MAITGRTALLAALGVLRRAAGAGLAAGPPRACCCSGSRWTSPAPGGSPTWRLSRAGATSTRLDEPVEVTLLVTNAGRRRVRGMLRDAWLPSAGATPRTQPIDIPPGERRRLSPAG